MIKKFNTDRILPNPYPYSGFVMCSSEVPYTYFAPLVQDLV